ncbi:oocyte zinc finger protein XlCOF6-like [Arapaima gigas]
MRKVVDESCGMLALRLEKSRRQNENKSQKADLSLMECELRESFESLCEPWMVPQENKILTCQTVRGSDRFIT